MKRDFLDFTLFAVVAMVFIITALIVPAALFKDRGGDEDARIRELELAVAQYSAQIETAKERGDWPSPMAGDGK